MIYCNPICACLIYNTLIKSMVDHKLNALKKMLAYKKPNWTKNYTSVERYNCHKLLQYFSFSSVLWENNLQNKKRMLLRLCVRKIRARNLCMNLNGNLYLTFSFVDVTGNRFKCIRFIIFLQQIEEGSIRSQFEDVHTYPPICMSVSKCKLNL